MSLWAGRAGGPANVCDGVASAFLLTVLMNMQVWDCELPLALLFAFFVGLVSWDSISMRALVGVDWLGMAKLGALACLGGGAAVSAIWIAGQVAGEVMVMCLAVCYVLFLALLGVGGLVAVYSIVVNHLSDRSIYRQGTRVFIPRREAIAATFDALKTSAYRRRYVEWLGRVSVDHLATLGRQDNRWPGSVRPNAGNDAASTLLAQLDARWMGIEA